jgi:hypothetical protein
MSGAHRLELLLCALYFGAALIGRLRVRNQPFPERIECERAENLAGPEGAGMALLISASPGFSHMVALAEEAQDR